MTSHRQQHIAKLLLEELNLLVTAELSDPRLADAMVDVTHVDVSPDLRSARVYVEHVLGPTASRQVLAALEHAQSYLREQLAENLNLRYVPELVFRIDDTAARAQRVDTILSKIEREVPPAGSSGSLTETGTAVAEPEEGASGPLAGTETNIENAASDGGRGRGGEGGQHDGAGSANEPAE